MSELQMGLIVLGGVAVLAVVAYNKWQEYRHRKIAEQLLRPQHADALFGQDAGHLSPPAAGWTDEADETDVADAAHEPSSAPVRAAERPQRGGRHEPVARIEPRVEPMLADDDDEGYAQPAPHYVADAAEARYAVDEIDEANEANAIDGEAEDFPLPAAEPVAGKVASGLASEGASNAAAAAWQSAPPPWEPLPAAAAMPTPVPAAAAAAVAAVPNEAASRSQAAGEDVPASLVSPAIDYVASFELVEPVPGDQILRSQRELLARLAKPVGWAGYNERMREWERVVEEGAYRRLRVGLLLADRRGPLGEADLLTFHGAMKNLADELMAVADLPPRDAALDAAIALDHFCANVDIQVGLNLVSQGQVFPGTKIRALAEAAGMVLDASGRFARCDDDGNVLYTLANQEAAGFSPELMRSMSTHGLVFILDVPRVGHGDRVFAQMLDLARRMAETLHGVLVDDNRRPLTEAMLDPFRRQIGQYQAQLAGRGLPAGGPLALRLFA